MYENRSNFLRSERLQKIRIISRISQFSAYFFSCKVINMNVNKWKEFDLAILSIFFKFFEFIKANKLYIFLK